MPAPFLRGPVRPPRRHANVDMATELRESRSYTTVSAEPFADAQRRDIAYIERMTTPVSLAEVAALVGDPARANMLCALLDGRALTAGGAAPPGHQAPPPHGRHLR